MEFISIENDLDWYENLSIDNKKNIHKGIDDLENGRIHSHEEVIKMSKTRIAFFKNP